MILPVTTDIDYAVNIIRQGRVCAFPTGTAYGLAADTQQGFALQRLKNLKQRPAEKSFTVCMKETLLDRYVIISDLERQIMQKLQGQSVTVLLRPQDNLAHLAREGRVGVRLIDHPVMRQFVEALSVPVTATSANSAGQPSCYDPECIVAAFPSRTDETTYNLSLGAIIDGGQLPESKASTIIRINQAVNRLEIVRPGALSAKRLASLAAGYGFTVVTGA